MLENELLDGFVFYGEVVSHVETVYLSQTSQGITVIPQREFRMPERTADGTYAIYPMGLASDCGPVPEPERAAMLRRFPTGTIVGVVGRPAHPLGLPGHVAPTPMGLLFALPRGCDLDELASYAHDYRERDVYCGSYRFEANKDIARLESASLGQRIETLERLAHYESRFTFADLVGKYVPIVTQGNRLLSARYPGHDEADCLLPREALDRIEWQQRMRLVERCEQRAPYAPPDRWNLYDAIRRDRADVLRAFLREGNDPDTILHGTPAGAVHLLEIALRARRETLALELLRAGASFEASGVAYSSLIGLGMTRVVDFMLERDPSYLERDLPLAYACRTGDYEVFEIVMRHAAAHRVDLNPALSTAASACIPGAPDAVRMLLQRGVPPTDGMLFAAARGASVGMVRTLLALGADPHARYREHGTPERGMDGAAAIDFAWQEYEYKSAEAQRKVGYVLHELAAVGPPLRSGVPLDGIARDGQAEIERHAAMQDRLMAAARLGFYDVAEALLTESGEDGLSRVVRTRAMRLAIEHDHPDVARLLLGAGGDPHGGALHSAVRGGQAGMVKHLIERGADPDEAVDGKSPLEVWYEDPDAAFNNDVMHQLKAGGAAVCRFLDTVEPRPLTLDFLRAASPECER